MARIQILPLPTIKAGEYEQTPFIIILDETDEALTPETVAILKHETGATTVIAYTGTLEAPGAATLTDEERDNLIAYLTTPPRIDLSDANEQELLTAAKTDHCLMVIPEPEGDTIALQTHTLHAQALQDVTNRLLRNLTTRNPTT